MLPSSALILRKCAHYLFNLQHSSSNNRFPSSSHTYQSWHLCNDRHDGPYDCPYNKPEPYYGPYDTSGGQRDVTVSHSVTVSQMSVSPHAEAAWVVALVTHATLSRLPSPLMIGSCRERSVTDDDGDGDVHRLKAEWIQQGVSEVR